MCHSTIGCDLIKIEFQPYWNRVPTWCELQYIRLPMGSWSGVDAFTIKEHVVNICLSNTLKVLQCTVSTIFIVGLKLKTWVKHFMKVQHMGVLHINIYAHEDKQLLLCLIQDYWFFNVTLCVGMCIPIQVKVISIFCCEDKGLWR